VGGFLVSREAPAYRAKVAAEKALQTQNTTSTTQLSARRRKVTITIRKEKAEPVKRSQSLNRAQN